MNDEQKFRLEFSEEQQCFHLAYLDDAENSNGYVTVLDSCTELEKDILKSYLLKNEARFYIHPENKISKEQVFVAIEELKNNFKII